MAFSHLINLKLGLHNPSNISSSQAFDLCNLRDCFTCLFSWLSRICLVSIPNIHLVPLSSQTISYSLCLLFFSTLSFPNKHLWALHISRAYSHPFPIRWSLNAWAYGPSKIMSYSVIPSSLLWTVHFPHSIDTETTHADLFLTRPFPTAFHL